MITNTSLCGLIMLSVVLSLTGCGDEESPSSAPTADSVPVPEPTPLLRRKNIMKPK